MQVSKSGATSFERCHWCLCNCGFDKQNPAEIVVAKLGSPLAIGIGENNAEFFIASDASPFIEYTKNAIYLEDEELAIVKAGCEIEVRK